MKHLKKFNENKSEMALEDYFAETEEDIIRLNHYTNLQPLCSKINRDIKKDKLYGIFDTHNFFHHNLL